MIWLCLSHSQVRSDKPKVMVKKNILIKPLITEKSESLSENQNQYTFVVDKRANKVEIKKFILDSYIKGSSMMNIHHKSIGTIFKN